MCVQGLILYTYCPSVLFFSDASDSECEKPRYCRGISNAHVSIESSLLDVRALIVDGGAATTRREGLSMSKNAFHSMLTSRTIRVSSTPLRCGKRLRSV